MRSNLGGWRRVSASVLAQCLLLTVLASFPAKAADTKLTPEEVVAKHLAALGTPEARAAIKSILALGGSLSTLKVGGSGTLEGAVVMASSGNRNLLSINYSQSNYQTERVAFDGKRLTVGQSSPGQYSRLALWFKDFEMPVHEGTMGGVLSTAWPLLNVAGGNFKLKFNGTKKVDGKDAYVLRFEGKSSNGLTTSFYFDAATFRHVRTEYERRQSQYGPNQPGVTQSQGESIQKLVENFSDFSPENGLDLPHTYRIELSIETLKERYIQAWTISLAKFVFNKEMADAEFDASGSPRS